jgi:homoserine kinase
VAEPTRGALIPGFDGARRAALDAGAIAFAISGSGPSVFAWAGSDADLRGIAEGVAAAFRAEGVESDRWIGPIRRAGAEIVAGDRAES